MNNLNLVVGGDLNLSLGFSETWGPAAQVDPLAEIFLNKIRSGKLLDVNLIKSRPTWRNSRVGEAKVAEKLDRFLLKEDLVSRIPCFRHWVGEGGDSDHLPILLEMKGPNPK